MDRFDVVVAKRTYEAEGIVSLALTKPDGRDLPVWEPGAHLDVTLPSGLIRQYSLCGDPSVRSEYRIAVLREVESRGGSLEVHEGLSVGTKLSILGPRNHFPVVAAARYLFIAGGIGITPILPMISQLTANSVPWRLVYGGRRKLSMAFLEEILAIPDGDVVVAPEDEAGLLDIARELKSLTSETVVYCCGPEGLLRAVEDNCERMGISQRLHLERFGANSRLPAPDAGGIEGFDVHLAKANITLTVPADRSLLSVIREALPQVPFSCEEGSCGTCETEVLEGVPDHRDQVLSEAEREDGKTMMICVGRSLTPRIVLNL